MSAPTPSQRAPSGKTPSSDRDGSASNSPVMVDVPAGDAPGNSNDGGDGAGEDASDPRGLTTFSLSTTSAQPAGGLVSSSSLHSPFGSPSSSTASKSSQHLHNLIRVITPLLACPLLPSLSPPKIVSMRTT
ncbi:hypothetical protein PF003_g12393 [Phytophthora fragariae]|nr:hypothetical protein PF003_g12393 [Phytophthora fragariae]